MGWLQLIYSSLLALILLLPSIGFAKTFNAESFTLGNGLQVVVIPNNRVPVVTHMVWYKVGAADELPTKSGLAHYLEHLMFKGTDTLKPGEFSRIVKDLGGNDNAFTGQDYTAYFQSIAVEHLERMMQLEADRMVNLKVSEDDFISEKNVVTEERRQRTDNDPKALFGEQMRNALFTNHSYGLPVIGWMHEIESYNWNDVKTFYDKWYAPNNAVVIISGDITAEEVKPLAKKTYGQIEPKELPARIRGEIPPAIATSKMELYNDRIKQESFQSIRLAPSYSQNKEDSLALQVLNEILSGGPTTRLYKNLVVDNKRAISVNLSYQSGSLDYGTIWVSAIPQEDVSLDEIKADIQKEFDSIIDIGVTEQEVSDAIRRLQDSAIFARDSLSGPARIIGYSLLTGSSLNDIENWPTDIGKVDSGQVQAVAKKYLSADTPYIKPPVEGYLYPKFTPSVIPSAAEESQNE
ncbi:MAG: pitrilysin family protein [Pseudomonadota bacterium]